MYNMPTIEFPFLITGEARARAPLSNPLQPSFASKTSSDHPPYQLLPRSPLRQKLPAFNPPSPFSPHKNIPDESVRNM